MSLRDVSEVACEQSQRPCEQPSECGAKKSENRVETCLPTSRMVENIFVRCEETQNKGNSSWMELAVGLNFFLSLDRARL